MTRLDNKAKEEILNALVKVYVDPWPASQLNDFSTQTDYVIRKLNYSTCAYRTENDSVICKCMVAEEGLEPPTRGL